MKTFGLLFIVSTMCLSCSVDNSCDNHSIISKLNNINEPRLLRENCVDSDKFILNDGVQEFRIELFNKFSPEYLVTNKVLVKEYTWDLDSIHYITIWYLIDNNKSIQAIDTCIWEKSLDF